MTMPVARVRARAAATYAGALVAAVAGDVALDPAHRHVPLCPFHALTGLDCPLCGGLRSVAALVRGHWVTAARDNAMVLAAIPVLTVLLARWYSGRPVRLRRPATLAVIAVAVIFTAVRNLPGAQALRP